MNELEQDKRYVFGDMIIVATTDFDFNPPQNHTHMPEMSDADL